MLAGRHSFCFSSFAAKLRASQRSKAARQRTSRRTAAAPCPKYRQAMGDICPDTAIRRTQRDAIDIGPKRWSAAAGQRPTERGLHMGWRTGKRLQMASQRGHEDTQNKSGKSVALQKPRSQDETAIVSTTGRRVDCIRACAHNHRSAIDIRSRSDRSTRST